MKVHVYTILRNEIRMIGYFLRHYETIAEVIFAYDDESDDGTREILAAHPKVVLQMPLFVGLDDAQFANLYSQAYRVFSRRRADWIICVDADEFLWHPDFMGELQRCQDEGIQIVNCQGYQMVSDAFPMGSGQIYEECKSGFQDDRASKRVLWEPSIDVSCAPGRHTVKVSRETRVGESRGFKLLHYRGLGLEYVAERHAKNAARITPNTSSYGSHNRGDSPMQHQGLKWFHGQGRKGVV